MRPSSSTSSHLRARRGRTLATGALAALASLTSLSLVTADHAAAALPESPELTSSEVGGLAAGALETLDNARASRNLARMAQYHHERDVVAAIAAEALGLDHGAMQAAWAAADLPHQQAVLAAISQLGVPYRSMASEPYVGFDCSGLTSYAWGRAGVGLTRSSGSQISAAAPRSHDTAMAGDLVQYPGHVMMYLGIDNAIVHSPYTGATVEITYISSSRQGSVSFGNPIG